MNTIRGLSEIEASPPKFDRVKEFFKDKRWHCGTETEDIPVYLGSIDLLYRDQLEQCRLYPRLQRGDFQSTSSALIGLWNNLRSAQGKYSEPSDFNFKANLLTPVVLKYPDDFPLDTEFTNFTKEFYSSIETMRQHGGEFKKGVVKLFDPSQDEIYLTNKNLPPIQFESAWWHERRHAKQGAEMGYEGNLYFAGLDILKTSGIKNILTDGVAHTRQARNMTGQHKIEHVTAPNFPSRVDWQISLELDRVQTIKILKSKPWFNLIAQPYKENLDLINTDRLAQISGRIKHQVLEPDVYGSELIDKDVLKTYQIKMPRSAEYKGYFRH